MKSSRTLAIAVSLALASTLQPMAFAGAVTGSLPVSLTVTGTCSSVNATALNFGSIPNNMTVDVFGEAQITVNCSAGTLYAIDLDNGTAPHWANSTRTFVTPTGYFGYWLYSDAARTQIWGTRQPSGTYVSNVMGATGTATHMVYGQTNVSSGETPGTYSDTVTVTVTY